MAFVKLDAGILNSTLWVDRDCREIFITALLMAHPIELREPMPQLQVQRLEATGFVVPAGWYGFVPAAGPGIIRMAMCDPAAGTEALVRLGNPDPESRTPDFDGRRLVRVDGGYVVLNFIKYREKDNTTKERSARYRERKKELASRRDVDTSHRDDTPNVTQNHQAEAEAEAEVKPPVVPQGDKIEAPAMPCPYQGIVDAYHELLPSLPKARLMPQSRQKALRKIWAWVLSSTKTDGSRRAKTADEAITWLRGYFERARANDFLMGRTPRGAEHANWQCDLDFLLTDKGMKQVIERTQDAA